MSAELLKLPAPDENRQAIEQAVRAVLDAHGFDLAGFAIVVWGEQGTSTADMRTRSPEKTGVVIPSILVPDFVRNRLLGMKIEQWAVETVRGRNAPEPG